ncbi:hypothetical protein EWM64_g4273 [Hericium alpestre]|uniref:Cytochrome P450 n=1 Tax=Hericium alpestre TaxID=135208 RepID=A0A4Y9ZZV3_9AGAM|nr:hypothetical protein EWM64_g4273 [Hericium alpestre]
MDDLLVSPYPVIGVLLCLYFASKWVKARNSDLEAIPAIGYTSPLLSYITAYQRIFDSRSLFREGYEKYKGGLFRIAHLNNWTVVATSPQLVEDIRKAPDDVLSFDEAIIRGLQIEYTIGLETSTNPYHINIVRSQLTRSLTGLFPEIRDELVSGCLDLIPAKENEWVKVPAYATVMKIVARTSNRIFVGLPLCTRLYMNALNSAKLHLGRDPEWLKLNMDYTVDVIKGAQILSRFPEFMKPLIARVTNLEGSVRTGIKHLEPLIKERRHKLELYGDSWEDKPNDFLMWLMEEASGRDATVRSLTLRIMVINFAAIHTSSMSFTHVLYLLAAHPEYAQSLREEVESVVSVEGWTKAAIGKMHKVDSFIREATRINGLGLTTMDRWVKKPFTFSNGVTVPAGIMISAASQRIHHDDEFYPDGDTFNPFRFADKREESGESIKHQMISTANDFLTFGHGRHAWYPPRLLPGRFFATNELKCLLAHIVTAYDVKLEDGTSEVPPNIVIGGTIVPAPRANVMFRKRLTAATV